MTLVGEREKTVLDTLLTDQPLGLPNIIHLGDSGDLIPVGLDNGNGHTKAVTLGADGRLVTVVLPTTYRTAREIRSGQRVVQYQVNDTLSAFWIGADALNEGDALPIGSTAERVSDRRHREFLAAALVELLLAAGHQPGIYNLAIGFAVPNNEIVLKDDGNRLGVSSETRQALREHIYGKTFVVNRTDIHGTLRSWTITFSTMLPQAQSIGTYLAWSRQPSGHLVDDGIEALSIVDIGTGDLQRTDIDVNPYRMAGEKLGRGTISMARSLAQKLGLGLNDAQAMRALIDRTVLESGMRRNIGAIVDDVIEAEGQDLVARLLPILQQNTRYILFTGGGVLLPGLRSAIEERAAAAGKTMPRNYTIVPAEHALTLNATGAMLAVIYAAAGVRA